MFSYVFISKEAVRENDCPGFGIYFHGAIGWTEEMDIGLYHLRTKVNQFDSGGTDLHLERVAAELENLEPDYMKLYG